MRVFSRSASGASAAIESGLYQPGSLVDTSPGHLQIGRHRVKDKRDLGVIDVTTISRTGKVIFGTTIGLINLETDETVSYRIVGEDEADAKHGKISITSPMARALIGKEIDTAEIYVPFSWYEPMWLENLGFAAEGEGWKLTESGVTELTSAPLASSRP